MSAIWIAWDRLSQRTPQRVTRAEIGVARSGLPSHVSGPGLTEKGTIQDHVRPLKGNTELIDFGSNCAQHQEAS